MFLTKIQHHYSLSGNVQTDLTPVYFAVIKDFYH